jgi:DNA-binding Lrp family transcriptional regulator
MDEIDTRIVNCIQTDFPIEPRPFQTLSSRLSLDESELIRRISRLKKRGIIRRLGGNFSPSTLGFSSTLCAAAVPPDQIDAFAEFVNRYACVTHNYVRDGFYNVWFTLIAEGREAIESVLQEIKEGTGVYDILDLPATSVYKIRAQFTVKPD